METAFSLIRGICGLVCFIAVFNMGCQLLKSDDIVPVRTFGDDLEFLRRNTEVDVLSDAKGQAQIAVSPALQGRVLTSTADGPGGASFGWINRTLIASGQNNPHINAYGGEDRFWLGPEGGQFSVFFKKGDPFDIAHWFTPPPLNEEPFRVVARDHHGIEFSKNIKITNYSDTLFDLKVKRIISLLNTDDISKELGIGLPDDLKTVAYQSENTITNTGESAWTEETGMLSIWILGMFHPSESTTVAIPFRTGPEPELGPIVNDAYFGEVPADRLVVNDGVIFFRGDGQYRSKIGLSARRARNVCGSYDAAHRALTIVKYNQPEDVAKYVNSMWEIQEEPFAGDVVNSYNDGPAEPGAEPLGPFYELETSSPAAALKPGDSITHTSCTFHFQGPEAQLDLIAQAILGVDTKQIRKALP